MLLSMLQGRDEPCVGTAKVSFANGACSMLELLRTSISGAAVVLPTPLAEGSVQKPQCWWDRESVCLLY